jgi:hypothetical protein
MLPTEQEYNELIAQLVDKGAKVFVSEKDKYQLRVSCPPTEEVPTRIQEGTGTILKKERVVHTFDINVAGGVISASQTCQSQGLDIHVVKGVKVEPVKYLPVDVESRVKDEAPTGYKEAKAK